MKKILDTICFIIGFAAVIIIIGAPGGCDQGTMTLGQVFLWEIFGFGLLFAARIVYNIRNIYFNK